MQSYSDLKLQCCDCKSSFTSASTLLQHFAEHVQRAVKSRLNHARSSRKKRREAESSSESNQSQTLSAESSCSDSSGLEQAAACKLARFDLQERLETCVSVKQEPGSDESAAAGTRDSEEQDNDNDADLVSTKGSEEYNSPLRFCTVTMEEAEEKTYIGSEVSTSSSKKVASRKQLLPKKIERKLEGLRKLAPKPETVVVLPLQSPSKKKYACHLCTKVFGWSTDLKRHILTHTGERPFRCETCQATFTRNFLLQKHQTKVHPCKPKAPVVKTEVVDMCSVAVPDYVEDVRVDPLKEEVPGSMDEDDDEDKLVITEEGSGDERVPGSPVAESLPGATWHHVAPPADHRCATLNQPDLFNATPIKVLTMFFGNVSTQQ